MSGETGKKAAKHSEAETLRDLENHEGSHSQFRDLYIDELSPEIIEKLVEEAGIPYDKFRGGGSFYDELDSRIEPGCVKACAGTSCHLCGAKQEHQNLRRFGHDCETVWCLGHCDRSPVSLDEITLETADISSEIRCLASQPVVTERILEHSIEKLDSAIAAGVYSSLPLAFSGTPEDLIESLNASGLRGRSRAGSLTGEKWKSIAAQKSDNKYVVTNGAEGNPGAFIDRVLMEQDPHTIIESMVLCGFATGAENGIIHVRSEYPHAASIMDKAIKSARKAGYLGHNICGSGNDFDIRIFIGTGSYAGGDESALLQSIEGSCSDEQNFPLAKLHNQPTLANHVETLVNVPFIVRNGVETYRKQGTDASSGTKAICLNAGFQHPGVAEVEYGITLRDIIEDIGGGGRDNQPLSAVIIGGPTGSIVQPKNWHLPLCFDVMTDHGIELGHCGVIAVPEDTDFRGLLKHLIEFSIKESCAVCAPCRLGTLGLWNALDEGKSPEDLLAITNTIEQGSLCSFGSSVSGPINTLIREFGERIF